MLQQFIAGAIENVLNQVLPLDPDIVPKMTALKDKTVQVVLTEPGESLTFIFKSPKILVAGHYENEVNARITGSLADFFQLGTSREKNVIGSGLQFEGEIGTAQAFQQFWEAIDIDWEEQVSKVTGDIIAHQLFRFGGSSKDWVEKTAATVVENTREYVQHEAMLTPTKIEVENFFDDLADLKADVARAEARLNQILAASDKDSE